ncbi:transcription factor Sox-19a-like [Dermacentor silvarum]|uniref:transcription factor Sox-19a-like n=1 Tax=Dermacentor silvarum TaxID=543639 RepID=UPI002100BC80|nr:transcription factor Sox-19a-like [Dermacentor silvarum]
MKPSGLQTPTFLDDDDDQDNDSTVSSNSSFVLLDSLGSVTEGPGDGHASSSAADSAAAEDQQLKPAVRDSAAAEASMPEFDVVVDLSVPGPSMSSEFQHSYQLRSRIPRPPNAFMLFAQERRRLVAAENPNENNQRVSSRLGKLWRSLSAADKEPYQRKAAEAAAVHRRKYPDYVYNPREARQRKEQERRAKAFASMTDGSGDQEQQPSTSTAATQGRSSPEYQELPHSLPLPQRNRRRATSAVGSSGAGRATPTRPTATVSATAWARSAAHPYNVHRFPGLRAPSLRGAIAATTASIAQSAAVHPFSQPIPLVACGRDCAAVPHPQITGSGLPHAADGSARQLGWFFDTTQTAAAHLTLGVAATPVLCWPLLATAGPPALAPSLPLLLPTAMTPAVARHHFTVPGPLMPPTRHDASAGSGSMHFFSTMQAMYIK